MQRALAASKMKLGEFMKELVCSKFGGWSHCPVGLLRAPISTGTAGTLRGRKLVASVTGGVWVVAAAVCRYLHTAHGFLPCPRN